MSSPLYCQKIVCRKRFDYNSPLLQYANRNRNKGYFDDITIDAGKSNFKANRIVLSCYSTFFEEKLKVNQKSHESVSIKDIDENSLQAIIDFIYSGEIIIDQDNVINLLNAGHKLKVVQLKEFCFEFLESVVNSKNCFYILDTANLYQNDSLKSKVYHHMKRNAEAFMQSLEFKKLPKQNVADFFSTLNDNESGNMTLRYEAIVTWTKHKKDERKMDFSDLFQLLKLDEIPREFLASVVSREALVQENVACAKLIMEKLAQIVENKELLSYKSSIICLGGWQTRSKVTEVYNLSGETPKQYPSLPTGLLNLCSLNINNIVVCIGGDSNGTGNATNQVWQMDLLKGYLQWKEIASMNEKRCNMGATIYQDSFVVAGGHDRGNDLRSAEVLAKRSQQWKAIASLNQARRDHALIASDDCLFALGGLSGGNYLFSVERLRGLGGKWYYIQPMNSPRFDFAAVICQNKIFAIGGRSAASIDSTMNSVEMIDHTVQKWFQVKNMNIERSGHSACVMNGKIYVVGGKNKHYKKVKEIECYDVTNDNWKIVAYTHDEWYWHSVVAY